MDHPLYYRLSRLLVFIMPLLTVSCIDESDEPNCDIPEQAQYTVTIGVQDKNYFNIMDIPELTPESESLPFSNYVEGISYRLENIQTKQIVAIQDYALVDPNEIVHTLVFNNIPNGRYILTTLGNLPKQSNNSRATSMLVTLHDNETSNTDIYMGVDTLEFSDVPRSKTGLMGRLKGELLIVCKNFPATTQKIIAQVDSVYLGIREDTRNYAETTYVTETFDAQEELLQMYLAPTVPNVQSSLTLTLFNSGSATPSIIIPDTKFTIERNKVTEIMIDFNANSGTIEISIRVAGAWEKINEMHIDIE